MPSTQTLVRSLIGLYALIALPAHAVWPSSTADGTPLPSLAPMLERVLPAVVNISTKTVIEVQENPLLRDPFFRHFFELPDLPPQQRQTSSLGSGVIVDADNGYVLTNHHVINKAHEIVVTLKDGRRLNAKQIGADPESDLAVIKVDARGLTDMPLADSSRLRVGDFVVAIGNPFGLGQTVTSGIVSALGRTGLGIEGYEDFIQTDASINPGNSGGALVNLRGELVGINTAILAPSGGNVGIGFAIPANMAEAVMHALVKHGEVRRGQLGVTIQDLTPELAQAFSLQQTQGAVVTRVQPGSPAEEAGLEPGDLVLSVNGKTIRSSSDLRNVIGLSEVGERVSLEVIHAGRRETRVARLAAPKLQRVEGEQVHPHLAGTILVASSQTGRTASQEGVVLEKISTASYAFRAGLRPGDMILSANRQRVMDIDSLKRAVAGSSEILLNVQRGNSAFFVLMR